MPSLIGALVYEDNNEVFGWVLAIDGEDHEAALADPALLMHGNPARSRAVVRLDPADPNLDQFSSIGAGLPVIG